MQSTTETAPVSWRSEHRRGVFAGDALPASLGLAGDADGLAEEGAGEIEQVDTDVEDGEPRLGQEIGLVAVDVEAGAEGDAGEARPADRALVDQRAHPPHRGLETEVLVDGEEDARRSGGLGDGHAVLPARGERLLHDHADARRRGGLHQRSVRAHLGDDVDEVGPLLGEHRRHVGVGRGAEALRRPFGLGRVEVADRDQAARLRRRGRARH